MIVTDDKIQDLVQLSSQIEQNPSQVLSYGKSKKSKPREGHWGRNVPKIQTADDRLIQPKPKSDSTIGDLKWAKQSPKNPIGLCQHVLKCLEGDLTYDNRANAKKSIKEAIEAIEDQKTEHNRRDSWPRNSDVEQIQNSLKTSTLLSDSFWEILPCYSDKNWKRTKNGFEYVTDHEKSIEDSQK